MRRRLMLTFPMATTALAMMPGRARAAERMAFTPEVFAAAQKAGRAIVVDVSAPWCPTCRAQKPVIDALAADPAMKDALFLAVDFDSQKDALKLLRVRSQSTLIAYNGTEERGRSIGVTDPGEIRALLLRAL
ncbi:MAG: thioredoxin family protein [Acetobacteraceae bacterium]|nr:thioredoxin family protein [Acetobacteraceae bacterium]